MYRRTLCRVVQSGGKDKPVKVYVLARNNPGIAILFQWGDLPKLVLNYLVENNFDTFFWVQAANINTEDPLIDHETWDFVTLTSSHSTHCCIKHGCKYNNPNCPIETGVEEQVFACYDCDQDWYKRQRQQGPKDRTPDPGAKALRSLREDLAAVIHDAWAHWTKYMLDLLQDDLSQRLTPVIRWRKQINTPYDQLTETEKDSDREWANKMLAVFGKDKPPRLPPEGWIEIERATSLGDEIDVKLPNPDQPSVCVSSISGVTNVAVTNVAVATAWSKSSLSTHEN